MSVSRRTFWLGCAAAMAVGGLLSRCELPPHGWLASRDQVAERSTLTRTPDPVSIGFAQDMSLHHEQALVMAGMAMQHGSPLVRAFARGVSDAQLRELGYLQGWLMLWDAPPAAASDAMEWMTQAYRRAGRRDEAFESFIDACGSAGGMPGMATAAQLDELSRLRGVAFDRRFLELMLRHHQGAVVMAQFAHQYAGHELVRGFALAMGAGQRKETMQMAGLLQASR